MSFIKLLITLACPFFLIAQPNSLPPFLNEDSYDSALHSYPLVAITFHYDPTRFCYLEKVLSSLATFKNADIVIITNVGEKEKLREIEKSLKKVLPQGIGRGDISIKSFLALKHPHNLTWCHKDLIRKDFLNSTRNYTHFIYLEDDIGIDFNNFCYFVHFRKELKELGLIPSFIRVEINKNDDFVATDYGARINVDYAYQIHYKNLMFINPYNPYTACFILDHELAEEYIISPSFDIESSSSLCDWGIRERAAMGLCYVNIPNGFKSRFVVPVDSSSFENPTYTWIYHLPNNYADNPDTLCAKLRMNKLFYSRLKEKNRFKKEIILKK
jgi:hypothetical protein